MKKELCPDGFRLKHILKASNRAITRLAWSPNGRLLASASYDQTVRLWNTETGREIREILGYSGSVFTVTLIARRRLCPVCLQKLR
jgi:WD40 repeat protein